MDEIDEIEIAKTFIGKTREKKALLWKDLKKMFCITYN